MAQDNRLTPDERQRIQLHRKYAATLPQPRKHRSLPGQLVFDFDRVTGTAAEKVVGAREMFLLGDRLSMDGCDSKVEKMRELSLAQLSELKLDKLPLQVLYALDDQAKDKGYKDFLKSIDVELRQRSLPRLAKITAGWIVVAALHHNIVSGATCDPQVEWAFEAYPALDILLCSPLLELVKFAFYEDDDEMYDDVEVADDSQDMSYDVLHQMRQDCDLVEKFESSGETATAETVESACNTILKALWTDGGKLLNDIAQCLIDEQSISGEKVRGLMACRNIDSKS